PLDRLAQLAATAAIKDDAWFETCRRKIISSRESLGSELEALGFDVLPSQANFVFAAGDDFPPACLEPRLVLDRRSRGK
ncbi:aminotransferase class I/II-fold pyridoxal phosphate-dependent enzyme, partial [Rhizobium ruizarguesonis]